MFILDDNNDVEPSMLTDRNTGSSFDSFLEDEGFVVCWIEDDFEGFYEMEEFLEMHNLLFWIVDEEI